MDIHEVRRAYDTVASAYHTRFADELAHKPYDRAWLDRFAAGCARGDRVVEVGCGDGHVAAYLANRGLRVDGLDLSPAMVAVARSAYPTLAFTSGNLLALPFADASVDAIVSFYSIVNLESDDCAVAFGEFRRVLRAGGRVTVAFHVGCEKLRIENWWETNASLDFYLHPLERVCEQLRDGAFEIVLREMREPYAVNVEAQTQRGYVLARAQ